MSSARSRSDNKSSKKNQRKEWNNLEKKINHLVHDANISNISNIINELFMINIVKGCGHFARSIIRAQSASPHNTQVYTYLVSVVNVFINIVGDYISKKTIISFCRSYTDNDKAICFSTIKFIAHLINQNVLHEFTAFEILIFLLKSPCDDDVELAFEFVKECGEKLSQVNPRGLNSIFVTLKDALNKSSLSEYTRNMIQILFAMREDQFKENPSIAPGLNLADENNQYTHMITFHTSEVEPLFEVFNYDKKYEAHEEEYHVIREMFFHQKKQETVIDQTETKLAEIRINMYNIIRKNNQPEDCAHKLLELHLRPTQEIELCEMIIDCLVQHSTYEQFYPLLGEQLCSSQKEYIKYFEKVFEDMYKVVDNIENDKLIKVAKFFSYLLVHDCITCGAFRGIRFTELKTTSSRGVYIKNLFLPVMEFLT